ncbi:hypothetical protein [Bacillus sp. 03113]|uniref:hypothetical protein n=1 Tax=Bacillus sp. 03113 TaxID=2578211 RepID=UPI00114438AE|nr:hypothetical protein [Bacillus sp. 03113]
MEDLLKNLKEDMNETILKDIDFQHKNKEKVRQAFYKTEKKPHFNFQPKLGLLLSISFTFLFLAGIGYFSAEKMGLFPGDEYPANKANEKKDQSSKPEIKKNLYVPPAQEETYEDMTKEDVLIKMLNTVDYFQTAAGEFELYDMYDDNSESRSKVEYKLSLKEQIGGYDKSTSFFDKDIMGFDSDTQETFYNSQTVWRLHRMSKQYQINDYKAKGSKEPVDPNDIFQFDLRKLYDSPEIFRKRPPASSSHLSIFPYEKAAYYLRNDTLWDIEKQNEEVLGHNTIVLYGKIKKAVADRMKGDLFRFWIDKDTGILLKYEVYDQNEAVTSYLHPSKLEINIPVKAQEFVPNLDGYSKMEIEEPDYKDPREKDIKLVDQADYYKEEVDKVMNRLRKDLSFLYEFDHPEIEIFSANYEQYKDEKQAYMTYSYKKDKNEDGSGRKLLYVRQYHKDTVVRSLGDFDTEKKNKLDEFEINGIHWESYKLYGSPNTHFIGTSGDYKYEVVTQDISAEETKSVLKSFKHYTDS